MWVGGGKRRTGAGDLPQQGVPLLVQPPDHPERALDLAPEVLHLGVQPERGAREGTA